MPLLASRPRLHTQDNDLIPGLPSSIVLDCLLPRIPWHTRPRLRVASKSWLHTLQDPTCYSSLTREATQGEAGRAMRGEGGLIVVHQLSQAASDDYFKQIKVPKPMPQPHCLSIYDEQDGRWRQLPPIPAVRPLRILHDCGIACVGRKVFVMGGWDPRTDAVSAEVYMLDLGSGLWQWEKRTRMHTAKSLFFTKAVAGKIYVVGGASSQNHTDEEPLPEVYDVYNDRWDDLPRVTLSRSFNYNGLAVVGCQILAFGFRSLDKGELVNFWRLYDPVSKTWGDWDCDHADCGNLLAGDHDLRDGIIYKLDSGSKKWISFDGRVCTKTWRWEGGKRIVSDSSCAHNFFVVNDSSKPHAYATICEGENKTSLTIWRGDIDSRNRRLSWQRIEVPGDLSMCSEMCYLQD